MRLDEHIRFVLPNSNEQTDGSFEFETYTNVYECFAKIKQDSSPRGYENFQLTNRVMVDVTMRWAGDFFPNVEHQIIWGDKLLTIQGQPDTTKKDYLKFKASYDPKITV